MDPYSNILAKERAELNKKKKRLEYLFKKNSALAIDISCDKKLIEASFEKAIKDLQKRRLRGDNVSQHIYTMVSRFRPTKPSLDYLNFFVTKLGVAEERLRRESERLSEIENIMGV